MSYRMTDEEWMKLPLEEQQRLIDDYTTDFESPGLKRDPYTNHLEDIKISKKWCKEQLEVEYANQKIGDDRLDRKT